MAYATQDDMTGRFGQPEIAQITDHEKGTSIDEAVLDAALDDATSEMDGYLATRHTLPLESPPEILVRICCDIARYFLYQDQPTDTVQSRYDNAIRFLRDVSMGRVSLGVTPTPDTNDEADYDAPDRVWSQDTLEDY